MASFAHYSNISSKVNSDIMDLWHDRLGYPSHTMIRRILNNVQYLPLKLEHSNQVKTCLCVPCAQGKLVIRPFLHKELCESPETFGAYTWRYPWTSTPSFWTILLIHGSQRCFVAFFSRHTSFYSQHGISLTPHPYHQVARSISKFSN